MGPHDKSSTIGLVVGASALPDRLPRQRLLHQLQACNEAGHILLKLQLRKCIPYAVSWG